MSQPTVLQAPLVVLSHRLQRDAGRENPSATDKRLMMSGPQAVSFEALPLRWEGGADDARAGLGFCHHAPFFWGSLCMVVTTHA